MLYDGRVTEEEFLYSSWKWRQPLEIFMEEKPKYLFWKSTIKDALARHATFLRLMKAKLHVDVLDCHGKVLESFVDSGPEILVRVPKLTGRVACIVIRPNK